MPRLSMPMWLPYVIAASMPVCVVGRICSAGYAEGSVGG